MEIEEDSTVKSTDGAEESEAPIRNGALKKLHAPLYSDHHQHHHPIVIRYKECLKNHAAALGGHAIDGCGEFMPAPASNPADPTSLKCAACGCHRNFHRRQHDNPIPALEYRPNHRHHPPPRSPTNDSPSPPPISSAYYPSAPQMLMALSHGGGTPISGDGGNRKRFRTKFTQDQKDKMLEFAEKIGWRMVKTDQDGINDFCRRIGVERCIFKVWMHNNKHSFSKKDQPLNSSSATNGAGAGDGSQNQQNLDTSSRSQTFCTNGSSSS